MSETTQPIVELIVTNENNTKRKFQCFSRTDGPGYWLHISEWENNAWQIVDREPLVAIDFNTSTHALSELSTSLVECPVCGRVGLPERIVQHDCATGLNP